MNLYTTILRVNLSGDFRLDFHIAKQQITHDIAHLFVYFAQK